jgi:hypothetical protein
MPAIGAKEDAGFDLWLEVLASSAVPAVLDRFAEVRRWRPYLFIWCVIALDITLHVLAYFFVSPAGFITPLWLVIPTGLTFGVYAARDLRDRYAATVGALAERRSEPGFDAGPAPISYRYRLGVLLAVYGSLLAFWLAQPAKLAGFYAAQGPVIATVQVVGVGFGYATVIADLLVMVAGVTVALPLSLRRTGVPVEFSDPTGYGGLQPLGRLLERAVIYYFVGVVLYSIRLFQQPSTMLVAFPGGLRLTVFALLWLLGVAIYAVPAVTLSRAIRARKLEKLRTIDADIRALGDDDRSLPDTGLAAPDIPKGIERELAIRRVKDTRELIISTPRIVSTAAIALVFRVASLLLGTAGLVSMITPR